MSEDLISVIVPVYNVEEYLEKCINSIRNQTYNNLEIIIVNDGSTDSCADICKDLATRDHRIKLINQENKGLSCARNAGIDAAGGKYIGFVDSDDFISETMYENLYNSISRHQASIATCGRYIFKSDICEKKYGWDKEQEFSNIMAFDNILKGNGMDVAAWDKLYKAELFDKIRFPEGEVHEDTAIIYRLLYESNLVVHTGTYEYYYRQRNGSITQSVFSVEKSVLVEKHLQDMQDFIKDKFPSLETSFKMHYAALNFSMLVLALKCRTLDEQQLFELERRKRVFNDYFKFLVCNTNNTKKNRLIAIGLRIGIYPFYLQFKNLLKKGE